VENKLVKVDPASGAVVSSYATDAAPTSVIFDGVSIWVATDISHTLTEYSIVDGSVLNRFDLGSASSVVQAQGIAFDGEGIWVCDYSGNIKKIDRKNGATLVTRAVDANGPVGVLFDGVRVWVTMGPQSKVLRF
jgi:streptogramin lyase